MAERQTLLERADRIVKDEAAERERIGALADAVGIVVLAVVIGAAAAGVHCWEFWQCSEVNSPKTCARAMGDGNVSVLGYCSFVNLVSLAGDRVYNASSTGVDALRGVCVPGERMHQNRLTGAQECVAHRTYPNALDASIMQAGAATPHERACGKWIDAVGSVTAVSSWSFYDDLGWRAAVLEAEADQGGGERLGADDIGKFRSVCESTALAGASGLRDAASVAYEYLVAGIGAPASVAAALAAMGWLTSHHCDTVVRLGVTTQSNGFQLAVSEGSMYEAGVLSEALFAVEGEEGRAAVSESAEAANEHVNDYAWNSPAISSSELLLVVDGALQETSANGQPATVEITAQLDGFLHLAKTGDFTKVLSFLHGTAALCATTLAVSVGEVGGIRTAVRGLARNRAKAASLGRLQVPHSGSEPMLELRNDTLFNATTITLSQLVGAPVGDPRADCLGLARALFPDRMEHRRFRRIVSDKLYQRLEQLTETMRTAVMASVLTNVKLRSMLDSPERVATYVENVRVRIPGARHGTWAGAGHALTDVALDSSEGVFLQALRQSRGVFLSRTNELALETSETCDGPPAYDSLGTNAYIYPWYSCTFLLLGMLRRPFADEEYDEKSLAARIGYIIAHEMGHSSMTSTYTSEYDTVLARYQTSVRNEALADLVAAVAIVESGQMTQTEFCNHVSQMWCARTPPLYEITASATHPGPNLRGDDLCAVLSEVLS